MGLWWPQGRDGQQLPGRGLPEAEGVGSDSEGTALQKAEPQGHAEHLEKGKVVQAAAAQGQSWGGVGGGEGGVGPAGLNLGGQGIWGSTGAHSFPLPLGEQGP